MKNSIPNFLKEKFQLRHAPADKFPDEIKQFMLNYYNHYNWSFEKTLPNIFKVMRAEISEIKKCKLDDCNNKRAIQIRGRHTKVLDCCCVAHSQKVSNLKKYGVSNISQLSDIKEKKKNISLEKYGETTFLKTEKFKAKSKKTQLERYGVEHAMKSDTIKKKQQNIIFEKYGVTSPLMSDEIKEKTKKTNLEKYGCEWTLGNNEIREKSKETHILKYGFDHPMKNKEYRKKVEQSNLEKYGVKNVMQDNRIKEKQQNSLFQSYGVYSPMHSDELKKKCLVSANKAILERYGVTNIMHLPEFVEKAQAHSSTNKTYIWKTGEEVTLQGYEHIVLKELELQGYTFDEIKSNKSDVPEIWYEFEGKQRRYYPDFYIPSENLIIEVKSEYYMNKYFQENISKAIASKVAGYRFKFEVR